ncbi:MAG: zinc-binding dehydrogenase, partial [Actinomycetota bacterium]
NGTGGGPWFGTLGRILRTVVTSPFVSQNLKIFVASANTEDLEILGEFVASGKITPVVGTVYPLEEAAQAAAEVGGGHARGKVVVIT